MNSMLEQLEKEMTKRFVCVEADIQWLKDRSLKVKDLLTLLYQNSQCRNRGKAPTEQSTAYGGSSGSSIQREEPKRVGCQRMPKGGNGRLGGQEEISGNIGLPKRARVGIPARSTSNYQARRLKLPIFGGNPTRWIFQTKRYFVVNGTKLKYTGLER